VSAGLNYVVHAINTRITIFITRQDGTLVSTVNQTVTLQTLMQQTDVGYVARLDPFDPGQHALGFVRHHAKSS